MSTHTGNPLLGQLAGLLRTMRPRQWPKNGFVFIPLLFDRKLDDPNYLLATIAGFALLCFMSSAVYIINDLADIKADRAHPTKRNRPLASGSLSRPVAMVAAVLLPLMCLPLAYFLQPVFEGLPAVFAGLLAGYFLIQLAYSYRLKHIVLLDVLTVASGFVIRVASGSILVEAERFSPWLYLFTTMLALFLVFGKRRHELLLLQDSANNHRAILDQYNIALLDEMIVIATATTVLTYSLYTFTAEGLPHNHTMMLTIPFVLYGIFRYLYLIHVRHEGGAPDEIALRDRPIQITVVLWGLAVALVLYLSPE